MEVWKEVPVPMDVDGDHGVEYEAHGPVAGPSGGCGTGDGGDRHRFFGGCRVKFQLGKGKVVYSITLYAT